MNALEVSDGTITKRKRADGSYSLYSNITVNGERIRENLSLTISGKKRKTAQDKENLTLAENILAKKRIAILEGHYGFESSVHRKACFVAYFEEQVREETERYKKGKKKAKTYQTYQSVFKHLKGYTSGRLPMSKVNVQWLEGIKRYIEDAVPSDRTRHTYFSKIRAVINKAYRENKITHNPVPSVKQFKKNQAQKNFLYEGELNDLCNTECSRNDIRDAFLFSCFTGLRLSDVISILSSRLISRHWQSCMQYQVL